MSEIDDYAAMTALYWAVENAMGTKQINEHARRINAAFPRAMRSQEEAMTIANGVDLAVRSTLEQRILQAGTALTGKPRSPGRI